MTSSKGIICLAALALLAIVCHAAMGSDASDGDVSALAISVNANGGDTASIPDFDGDGTIGFGDFVIFAGVFGAHQGDEKYDATYDLNGDGEIDFSDFVIFVQNFGKEAPHDDRAVLVAFYEAMDGPNWNDNTNWLSDKPIGDWYGITTDNSGRVIRIFFWYGGLKGQLPLQFGDLTALKELTLPSSEISDLSVLSNLPRLTHLNLRSNRISDVSPLLSLRNLRVLDVFENPLDYSSVHTHIPRLQVRGVDVKHHGYATTGGDVTIEDGLLIHNDNLVVLPAARGATHAAYTSGFYQHFDDEFDFLVLVSSGFNDIDWPDGGFYSPVANDVQGIGLEIYSKSGEYGSAGRLHGIPFFSHPWWFRGIILHEVLHRWAAYGSLPFVSGGHFVAFCNIFGAFGGAFSAPFELIVDLGGNRFRAKKAPWSYTYGPLELYLAGLIPPEDVPDFWVAVDGKWIDRESGTFSATDIVEYTVYDIIHVLGRRIPPAPTSQRDFRAAVVLLINEEDPTVDSKLLESLSADIAWFSFSGTDESEQNNFYEATGGRATITMDGLSQFRGSSGADKPASRSFGTSAPPVVDYLE